MKSLTPNYLFLLFMQFLSLSLLAQKHFSLTIQLPQAIHPAKIEVWVDNGKELKKMKPQTLTAKQLVLTSDYYSTYAVITLQYPPDSSVKSFARDFFVGEKPAAISFHPSRSNDLPFANYSLFHALDFAKEKKQMDDFSAAERKTAMDYEAQYGDKLFSGNDTVVRNHYFKVIRPAVARKKMAYIINHPQSYYSFYSFRTEVAKPNVAPWDSLLLVFNRFPNAFKYSDEGNDMNAFLQGRLSKQQGNAVDFAARDIAKNTVTLSQFKGRKVVLLHFWATWCTPCMRELPALKEISEQYKGSDLQIISIALPSAKYADYLATIETLPRDWIHVYNDPALQNKYGSQPIPRICLIDKTGKLVYDNIGLEKANAFQLTELKEKLKEALQN